MKTQKGVADRACGSGCGNEGSGFGGDDGGYWSDGGGNW